jgi:magnesium transporter
VGDYLFLTELLGLKVYDSKGLVLGRVKDAGLVPLVHPARVDRFLIGTGWTWLTVRHDQVASISLGGIRLRAEQLTPYHDDEYMLRVVRDLLDQQIIDAQGRKVVRVSDISFTVARPNDHDVLLITDVDIGIRSVLRRVLQGVLPRRAIRLLQAPIRPKSILWEYCNIIEPDPRRRLRLNINLDKLENMHPADLADIVEELSPDDRGAIIEAIDSEIAADALSEVEQPIQAKIVEALDPEKAAEILEEMDPDAAADVLAEVGEQTSEEILEEMSLEDKTEVQELMEFEEDSAGALMNPDYVALPNGTSVAHTLGALRLQAELIEAQNTVFVVDADGRLTGTVPLARLLLAEPAAAIETLATEQACSVRPDERARHVTELFDKYNLLVLPVLDEGGKLTGVITVDDIISLLNRE